MNKEHFNNEYIYDKIRKDSENIQVPDSLKPEVVEERLKDVKQNTAKRFSLRPSLAAVACLVLVCGILLALLPLLRDDGNEPPVKVAEDPSTSYEDICTVINNYYEEQNEYEEEDTNFLGDVFTITEGSASVDSGTSSPTQKTYGSADMYGASTANSEAYSYSDTDVQVEGVMEGDVVKTNGSHIFTLKNSTAGYCVNIYKVDGPKVEKQSEITISQADSEEMYIQGSQLILFSREWTLEPEWTPEQRIEWLEDDATIEDIRDVMYESEDIPQTRIDIYDISTPEKPTRVHTHTQSGSFNTSRLADGYLYTFTDYTVYEGEYNKDKPEEFMPKLDDSLMEASDVYLPDNSMSNSFMVMTSLRLKDPTDFVDSIATLGNFDTYYMNNCHIYTVNSGFYWEKNPKTTIAKYAYENGVFEYKTSTKVRGKIENSYYMHEYEGNFVFVYTDYDKFSNTTNGLCVLDENLELLGEISDLGYNEDIYSSYFIDNMAYFVTFKETDPVFAVDISDPKNPVLKSKLKLPGFSSYLHSFGENLLLGIGQGSDNPLGTESVKLSLFSINDNYEIKEKVTELIGTKTTCYAGDNHKVVFIDEERGLVGLGIYSYSGSNFYTVYKYENGKFKKVLNHITKYSTVENIRGLRIGEYFYIVNAGEEIECYDINTWEKAK